MQLSLPLPRRPTTPLLRLASRHHGGSGSLRSVPSAPLQSLPLSRRRDQVAGAEGGIGIGAPAPPQMGGLLKEEGPAVDVSVEGTLVWLRRPNGSWWPSIVISPQDVPEGCAPPPRCPATPIMLLGRRPDGPTFVYAASFFLPSALFKFVSPHLLLMARCHTISVSQSPAHSSSPRVMECSQLL